MSHIIGQLLLCLWQLELEVNITRDFNHNHILYAEMSNALVSMSMKGVALVVLLQYTQHSSTN